MNRRNVLRGLLATGAVCALPSMRAIASSAQPPRVISMTTHYSLQHPATQNVFIPWANTVRERSQGRLDVRIAAPDELCPDENVYNAVLMNSVTLGGFVPNMMISPLPIARIMEYALLYPDARTGSQMVWDVFCNSPELRADLGLVHILWTWISPAMYLHTMGKTLRSLDDFQGLRVVVWDTTAAAFLGALGAQPVFSPAHFTVNMLRMKMADAVIAPFAPLPGYDLLPLLKCTLDIPLSNACFFAAFNREVWSSLPAEERHLLESTTGEKMAAACGETLDKGDVRVRTDMKQRGHTFMSLSPAERAKLYEPLIELRNAREQELIDHNLLPEEGLIPLLQRARARVLQTACDRAL